MNRKVLMVYPEIPTTYWSLDYAMDFTEHVTLMPPLGLITVAAMLPESWDVKLVDLNVRPLDIRDVEEADIVFISAMIVQKESFARVVRACNETGTPVAAGGPYPTNSHDLITGVDYFILNEAEVTLPMFLEDYEAGRAGKIYSDAAKPDITLTPVPRFDLLDIKAYATMALQNSRGCPFNCEFCDIIELFGRVPRYKLPEQFCREMDAVLAGGYNGPLFIVDDNFIGNKRKVKELLRAIIAWQKEKGFPFSFYTEASINLADDEELLDLMVHAGFNMVFIGIETPVTASLENTNKQQNTRSDLHQSVRKIQDKGIEVMAGFIVGFDDDPENIFDLQIEFIRESAIPMAMVGLMLALPNTQLYRRLEMEGRLLKQPSGNNTHDLDLNFVPVMDRETLINGYHRVISTIYSPKNYFDRCDRLLKRLPRIQPVSRPLLKKDLKSLSISLVRQIFSAHGFYYLRLLARTLTSNPYKFPAAVNLAVKGFHFFKMTEEITHAHRFNTMLKRSLKDLENILSRLAESGEELSHSVIEEKGTRLIEKFKNRKSRLRQSIQKHVKENLVQFENECLNIVSRFKVKPFAGKGGPLDSVIE